MKQSQPFFPPYLDRGSLDTGPNGPVRFLQNFLIAHIPAFARAIGLVPDGDYGDKTLAGVAFVQYQAMVEEGYACTWSRGVPSRSSGLPRPNPSPRPNPNPRQNRCPSRNRQPNPSRRRNRNCQPNRQNPLGSDTQSCANHAPRAGHSGTGRSTFSGIL